MNGKDIKHACFPPLQPEIGLTPLAKQRRNASSGSCTMQKSILMTLEVNARQGFGEHVSVVLSGVDVTKLDVPRIDQLTSFEVTALDVPSADAGLGVFDESNGGRLSTCKMVGAVSRTPISRISPR